jgi:phosphatidylglycerol:prolipoprotein diacylglycerol transferase
MFPILLQFHFPKFLGHLTWIEIAATVVVIGLLFLWRRSSPRFSYYGFFLWVGIYAALRGMIWYAEPGYHFKLHTYGVMIAVGFVVPIYLAVRQARRELIDPNIVLDLAFWILIAAMAGSRILFIIVNADDYIADLVLLIKVWRGGLVFYGGFIGAVAASWYYCYRKGISFLRISDLLIPSVALGHFFGRLGCYSAGCCHGSPTGVEWFGAVFTAQGSVVSRSGLLGTPIHPTQLYEAFGELCIFVLLLFLRPRKRYNGQRGPGFFSILHHFQEKDDRAGSPAEKRTRRKARRKGRREGALGPPPSLIIRARIDAITPLVHATAGPCRTEKGIVRLKFVVNPAGYPHGFRIIDSSGVRCLDDEIDNVLHLAEPYPYVAGWIPVTVKFAPRTSI